MGNCPRIVIALGGNALGNTPGEQMQKIDQAAPSLVGLIAQRYEIIVSHGNGPQVGMIQRAFGTQNTPEMPLPECVAMSEGYIGYHLQQGILRELRREGMPWHVATMVTQVIVDPTDQASAAPNKPVGAFYSEETAMEMVAAAPGLHMKEDAGRGWRRVVASPRPLEIVERESILNLLDNEFVVIACGGGGIPVVRGRDGSLSGIDAVIDKDYASALLADSVDAEYLFILTAVERVCLNWGRPDCMELATMTVGQARGGKEGHFAAGSMLPKVMAAAEFVGDNPRRRAVICSLAQAPRALSGKSGTVICTG